MYSPVQHQETRLDVLHALIRAHPLGVWVVAGEGELVANHIPFMIDSSRGPFGTLVARRQSEPGPQSYISPSWYPSKHRHGKAVPTWNYAVVHAHGVPRFIEDAAWLRTHVERLTDEHEAAQALPWKVVDAPADYIGRLIGAIVGVEIPISRLEGKWKTAQNRPNADKLGVIAALASRDDSQSAAMAALIQNHLQ